MSSLRLAPALSLRCIAPLSDSSSTLFPTRPSSALGHHPTSDTADGQTMPVHWRNEYPRLWLCLRPIFYYTFKCLCLIAVGGPNLEQKWRAVNLEDGREYHKEKSRISTMVTTTNIVASLLLASASALISTTPPRPDVLNYNQRGPYICLLASFGIILGGIVVGCAVLFVLSATTAKWARDTLMQSQVRIWIMLILLAYPFLSIGAGTATGVMGLLAAAWMSDDRIVNLGSVALFAVPVSLIGFFAFISRERARLSRSHKSDAEAYVMPSLSFGWTGHDRAPLTSDAQPAQPREITRAYTL